MRKIQIPEYCEDCHFWKENLDRCTLYWEEGKDFSAICKAKEVWIWEEGDKKNE